MLSLIHIFQAGATDLKNAAASLHAPETELGVLENIQMYVAAAYTEPGARYLLLEASSGMTRYEIQITVEAVSYTHLDVYKRQPMGGNQEGNNLAGSWTFKGEFDGQGHKIRNLYINKGDNSFHTGLFGAVTAATIKNITIE